MLATGTRNFQKQIGNDLSPIALRPYLVMDLIREQLQRRERVRFLECTSLRLWQRDDVHVAFFDACWRDETDLDGAFFAVYCVIDGTHVDMFRVDCDRDLDSLEWRVPEELRDSCVSIY